MILKEFYCTIKVVNYSKKHCDIAQFKIIIYFNIFWNVIYFCDGKAEFSAVITPVFSVTWSFRNRSNILVGAQETFIIISVENCCAA